MSERDEKQRVKDEEDLVDEAVADSFPASDPPTYAIGKRDVPEVAQPEPPPSRTPDGGVRSPSRGEGDEG